ncbi:MAG: hypothetical protein KDC98_06120 [Planctomycetes bacterium]|nr:hypothetical protein [Planctomycetota bacterium]
MKQTTTARSMPAFVHELFDRGLDPLSDPRTERWLLDDPEALEAFAATRQTLRALSAPEMLPVVPAAPGQMQRSPWLVTAAAMAAAAVAVLIGCLIMRADPVATTAPLPRTSLPRTSLPRTSLPRPDFATRGGVVYCRVATTRREGTRATQRVEVFRSPGGRTPYGSNPPGLDRRDRSTLSTYVHLPGPRTPWSVAQVTEERALLP